jgi:hypothetical protein
MRRSDCGYPVDRWRIVEQHPAAAVDLQIDEPRQQIACDLAHLDPDGATIAGNDRVDAAVAHDDALLCGERGA